MATVSSAPLTLEDFARLPADGVCHEISSGELITLPPAKSLHSRTALIVMKLLQQYLSQYLGSEAIPEAGYVLSRDPLTIRQPDLSVLNTERIRSTAPDNYFEGAPELAIEIVSPSDSAEDLEIKVRQYLQAGAQQVWILYPKSQDVHVYSPGGPLKVLESRETLEGGATLPGFAVKVSDLFVTA